MLKVFKVKGFKNFSEEICLDFSKVNEDYDFRKNIIADNIITKSAIYGVNGSGKSNLGLAIFDIIQNLTDYNINNVEYQNYLSLDIPTKEAEFYYCFQIGKSLVEYKYIKLDLETLVFEELKINGKIYIKFDRRIDSEPLFNFDEAKNLNRKIGNNKISAVKYAINNTLLAPNTTLKRFMKFISGMLFFKSVEGNRYIGYTVGSVNIGKYLVENNQLDGLNLFLKNLGIDYKIVVIDKNNKKDIGIYFEQTGNIVPFYEIASSGTKDLVLLYFWLYRMNEMSFVYIDEFDAHYHFRLSQEIVKKLIELENVQIVVTTHTSSLISNRILRPDCYFKLENNEIKSLDELATRDLEEAHDIEKIFRAGGFDGK